MEQTALQKSVGERSASRVARTAAGVALVVTGTVLLFLPGPGWLTIAAGVALLRRKRASTNAQPVGV